MKTKEGADKAIAELNRKPLNGKPISIEYARSKPTVRTEQRTSRGSGGYNDYYNRRPYGRRRQTYSIHIGNLPPSATSEDIGDLFKDFKVKKVVATGRIISSTGKSYGFVEFENEDEKQRALALSGKLVLSGETLVIAPARS